MKACAHVSHGMFPYACVTVYKSNRTMNKYLMKPAVSTHNCNVDA